MIANLVLVCAWDYFVVNKMMPGCVGSANGKQNSLQNMKGSQQSTFKEFLLNSAREEAVVKTGDCAL
jgi:hypothetical protein